MDKRVHAWNSQRTFSVLFNFFRCSRFISSFHFGRRRFLVQESMGIVQIRISVGFIQFVRSWFDGLFSSPALKLISQVHAFVRSFENYIPFLRLTFLRFFRPGRHDMSLIFVNFRDYDLLEPLGITLSHDWSLMPVLAPSAPTGPPLTTVALPCSFSKYPRPNLTLTWSHGSLSRRSYFSWTCRSMSIPHRHSR